MKYLYILLSCLLLGCQPIPTHKTIVTRAKTENFPADWIGHWKGDLNIYKNNTLIQSVLMQLKIEPIDSTNRYTWEITYGEGEKASVRPYELVTIDAAKGHYQTDEKNTIFLDAYYMGGTLYSRFLVNNSLLLVSTWRENDHLIYDIIVGDINKTTVTGNDTLNDIPAVSSYLLSTKQKAVLSKVE